MAKEEVALKIAHTEAIKKYIYWRLGDLVKLDSKREDMENAWDAIWKEVHEMLYESEDDLEKQEIDAIFREIERWMQVNSPYHYHKSLLPSLRREGFLSRFLDYFLLLLGFIFRPLSKTKREHTRNERCGKKKKKR